ncbi:cuticular protein RR-2 [Spodoptera litura]|uniref:Cuticular protein RR-2 n=1 Tax=Spodoptera litura TaxID=69820 RepID=A0A4V6DVD8_SPOLT|nr:cuticular protein RR-2 [Spodoptera litura]
MYFKELCSLFHQVLCIVTVVAVAVSAEYGHSSQHIHRHDGHHQVVEFKDKHGHHHVDYYAHPKYEFAYKVDDKHTGDHKEQHEHRDGHDTKSDYKVHVEHIVPHHHHHHEHH